MFSYDVFSNHQPMLKSDQSICPRVKLDTVLLGLSFLIIADTLFHNSQGTDIGEWQPEATIHYLRWRSPSCIGAGGWIQVET